MAFLRRLLGSSRPASTVEVLPDRVWMTADAKLRAIGRELAERAGGGAAAIGLVAHFPDQFATMERVAAAYDGAIPVRAMLARQLSTDAARSLPLNETATLDLIVAERHPLASVDDELIRFAEALPCRCRMVHHLSLDDAFMATFGSERVRAVLERLGAEEDEPIAHSMVTASIRKAQKRIEASAVGSADANSAAEWLERNTRPH